MPEPLVPEPLVPEPEDESLPDFEPFLWWCFFPEWLPLAPLVESDPEPELMLESEEPDDPPIDDEREDPELDPAAPLVDDPELPPYEDEPLLPGVVPDAFPLPSASE